MAAVTAKLVKELREKTAAGMMDCKKALDATEGDLDKASEWLRTKGLAQAVLRCERHQRTNSRNRLNCHWFDGF